MLPYLIAGAIGFGIGKLFENGGETFMTGGQVKEEWKSYLKESRVDALVKAGYSKNVAKNLSSESWDSLEKQVQNAFKNVLISEEVESMKSMMESLYTYGGLDKDNRYLEKYKISLGNKLFNKTFDEYRKELEEGYDVDYGTYTDSEGWTYNSLRKTPIAFVYREIDDPNVLPERFTPEEVIEFIGNFNQDFDTNYKDWQEFNKGEEYRKFEPIMLFERKFENGGEMFMAGGRITTNEGIIESFLNSNREVRVGNLESVEMDDIMYLRNYRTFIAKRMGDKVKISSQKYSKTTSTITNRLKALAEKMGYSVEYVTEKEIYNFDEFVGGGEVYALVDKFDENRQDYDQLYFKTENYDEIIGYIADLKNEGEYDSDMQLIEVSLNGKMRKFDSSMLSNGGETFMAGGNTDVNIEEGDSVIMYFNQDTELEIFDSEDFELEEPNSDIFKKGEEFEVDIFGVDDIKYDVQFGDGSVAFIRKDNVTIVSVNEDKYVGGGEITDADLNYYIYSTKKVRIAYLGKIQGGAYFSLKDALKEIEYLTMAYPKNEIEKYAIITPDKTFNLGKKEYNIRFDNGGEAGSGLPKKRRRSASIQYGRSDTSIDKQLTAKPVGYRFTNAKANQLRKDPFAKPTEAQVKKYLGKGIYKENRKNRSDRDRNVKL